MPDESEPQTVDSAPTSQPRLRWADRAVDRGEEIVRRALAPLRPRVSLASGSLMVLLTLILPIGYESCGPKTKGYELVQGSGDWPTFLGITLREYFGSPFYGLLLVTALLTTALVGISLVKPAYWPNRGMTRRWFIATGGLSLFLLVDVAALLPMGTDEWGSAAVALIVASCLLPIAFWPRRVLERWLGPLVLSLLAVWVSTRLNLIYGDVSAGCMIGVWMIYGVGPLGIWLALVAGRFASQRAAIRRGLIAFYIPAAMGNLWFYAVAGKEGIWGFVPGSIGLFLMALGYARLAKEGLPSTSERKDSAT